MKTKAEENVIMSAKTLSRLFELIQDVGLEKADQDLLKRFDTILGCLVYDCKALRADSEDAAA